jgi:hypothetical protein
LSRDDLDLYISDYNDQFDDYSNEQDVAEREDIDEEKSKQIKGNLQVKLT